MELKDVHEGIREAETAAKVILIKELKKKSQIFEFV